MTLRSEFRALVSACVGEPKVAIPHELAAKIARALDLVDTVANLSPAESGDPEDSVATVSGLRLQACRMLGRELPPDLTD